MRYVVTHSVRYVDWCLVCMHVHLTEEKVLSMSYIQGCLTKPQLLNTGTNVKLGNHLNGAKVYFLSYRSLTEEKSYLNFDSE